MDDPIIQSSAFLRVISPRTGHSLRVNADAQRLYVPNEVTLPRLLEALTSWSGPVTATRSTAATTRGLNAAKTAGAFIAALERLLSEAGSIRQRIELKRLLLWLWSHDLVALPAQGDFAWKGGITLGPETLGKKWSWLQFLGDGASELASDLIGLASTAIGATEWGDVLPMTVDQRALPQCPTRCAALKAQLVRCYAVHYGEPGQHWARTWKKQKAVNPIPRSDLSYRWVLEKGVEWEAWRAALESWTASEECKGPAREASNLLLGYLVGTPNIERDPMAYCRRDCVPRLSLHQYIAARRPNAHDHARQNNRLHRFFEWLIDRHSPRDTDGRAIRSVRWLNPLRRMRGKAGPAQTHRQALPLKLVKALIGLLRDDDFAWPRTVMRDYIGGSDGLWCPVRAVALLLMLYTPERSGQIRFLESDEGDNERYTPEGWEKVRETIGPRRGVLRRHQENGRDITLLYINTSKTYDRNQHSRDPGHVLAWSHEEAIAAIEFLGRWQREHNPVSDAVELGHLHDWRVARAGAKAFADVPPARFLMRDPLGRRANEPLCYARLADMWRRALDELEKRIQDGRADPALREIGPLITKRTSTGRPIKERYDLHSLRVTALTTLRMYGGLDLDFVSKRAANHATLAMTSHYMSPSPSVIAQHFANAEQRLVEAEEDDFAFHLLDARSALWRPVVDSDHAGLARVGARGGYNGTLCPSGLGLCPNGAAQCGATGRPCSALVTGPAFLVGLVQRLRVLEEQNRLAFLDYQDWEGKVRQFEEEWARRGGDGEPPKAMARAVASSRAAAAELQNRATELQWARQRVIQSLALTESCSRSGVELDLIFPSVGKTLPCQEGSVVDGIAIHAAQPCDGDFKPGAGPLTLTITPQQARAAGEQVAALLSRLGSATRVDPLHQLLGGQHEMTGRVTAILRGGE